MTETQIPSAEVKDIGDNYEIPAPEPFISFNALKDRIRHHYEVCSDYYYSMWYALLTTALYLHTARLTCA